MESSAARRPSLVRVLVVDDHELSRNVLRRLVCESPALEWLGECDSGEAGVASAFELEPDLVVMDVMMPGIGGIAAAGQIKAARPSTIVVLVSTTHPDDLPGAAADLRVDEIVWKAGLRPHLLEEIWSRHGGAEPGT